MSMKVYVSSTSEDLAEHREQVNRIVRQSGHEAIAMEDYVATGSRPLNTVPPRRCGSRRVCRTLRLAIRVRPPP